MPVRLCVLKGWQRTYTAFKEAAGALFLRVAHQ
jgi:hypothetical protein